MTAMADYQVQALPKQIEFIASDAREVLYSGAFGAGKTRALCLKLVSRAIVPGAREGLCRKTFKSLRASTLKTLLEPSGDLPPVLPKELIEYHNHTECVIKIRNGGLIMYFGCDDPDKLGSYEFTGIAVDEFVELTLADHTMLLGRIRIKVDGARNQIYGACNPGSPAHWLAERFGLAGGHAAQPNCHAIRTKTTDNTFLDAEYIETLQRLTGMARRRYVEGEWAGSDGLVYDRWQRDVHAVARPESNMARHILAIDVGYTNPTAMLDIGIDGDERAHVCGEWYERKQVHDTIIDKAAEMHSKRQFEAVIIDPSEPGLIESMRQRGLPAEAADNSVMDGINTVQQRLEVCGDGLPRLTVDPDCTDTIREFESYEWAKSRDGQQKDQPAKVLDHAMDALRYGMRYLDGGTDLWVA